MTEWFSGNLDNGATKEVFLERSFVLQYATDQLSVPTEYPGEGSTLERKEVAQGKEACDSSTVCCLSQNPNEEQGK